MSDYQRCINCNCNVEFYKITNGVCFDCVKKIRKKELLKERIEFYMAIKKFFQTRPNPHATFCPLRYDNKAPKCNCGANDFRTLYIAEYGEEAFHIMISNAAHNKGKEAKDESGES